MHCGLASDSQPSLREDATSIVSGALAANTGMIMTNPHSRTYTWVRNGRIQVCLLCTVRSRGLTFASLAHSLVLPHRCNYYFSAER